MKKLAPISRNEGDNSSSITTVSLKQLKLLMMSSSNSSLALHGKAFQQFLPRDYKKCTLPLWLPSCKRESFLLVLPPTSHGKESKRNRTAHPLTDFQGSVIQSDPTEDKQHFPKGNADGHATALNLLAQVSLQGWDPFPSKFSCWRSSSWGRPVTMQSLCFPYRKWYMCTVNRSFPGWIQKSIFWLLLGPL